MSRDDLVTVYGSLRGTSPGAGMTNVTGLDGPHVSFALAGSPLDACSVESSTILTRCQPLGPTIPRYSFTDTNAPALPQRYYRLQYP